MVCRCASALILASALLACSREPAPPAPAPSGSLPPITISRPIRPASTVDPHNYPDHPVSIPGVLTIRAPPLDVQSHDVGQEPWQATFLVTNETTAPLTVQVSDLVFRSDDVLLPPEYRTQPLVVKVARAADDIAVPIERGTVTFTVPPRRQIEIDLDADLEQRLRVYFRTGYRHEAVFSTGGARIVGRGYEMYFLPPHRMPNAVQP